MKLKKKTVDMIKLTGSFLSLFVVVVALLLAVALILNRTYGWFSSNRIVTNTGMRVRVENDLFEISRPSALSLTGDLDTYLNTNYGYEYSINETTKSKTSIICRLTNDAPLNGVYDLYPGSYGRIMFDIVPKVSGDITLDLTFNIFGLTETPTDLDPAVKDTVNELLQGHILIFETKENGAYSNHITGTYRYTTASKTPTQINGEDHYTVTLYWIWPATFSQMVLEPGDHRLYNAALFSSSSSERDSMKTYIADADNRGKFFYNLNITGITDQDHQPDFTSGFEDDYYVALSDSYNNGDQLIGDNAYYFIIEIQADPVFTPSE